ncbi:MAG: glycosyltransferase, partial [Pseudomonadota bacterium]
FIGLDNYPVLNPAWGSEYFGGESVQQTLLARAFVELGYDVSMIVKDHGQSDGEVLDGIRVLKTYADGDGIPGLRFFHPRMTSIWRAFEAADAAVYYQSCAGMMTGLVARYCAAHDRKLIFRIAHDTDCVPGEELIRFSRDRVLYRYGLKRADFISAQGVHQQELLTKHHGLDSAVTNMAVEVPSLTGSADKDIDVLWVNNLREFKRPDLAIELARLLPERRMVMIGGPVPGRERYFEEMRAAAAEVPNLEFLGAVPYAEVNEYFHRTRVFVNTSDSEGFPNSFLQAWVRAVPVISFFDPDGLIASRGLGAAPAALDAMQAAVVTLLDDDTRAPVATACREFAVEHYGAINVARRYIADFPPLAAS